MEKKEVKRELWYDDFLICLKIQIKREKLNSLHI